MASIWLLRGNAGAWIARNCDDAATGVFLFLTDQSYAGKASLAAICCVDEDSIQVHRSLKCDRFAGTASSPGSWRRPDVRQLITAANVPASLHAAWPCN